MGRSDMMEKKDRIAVIGAGFSGIGAGYAASVSRGGDMYCI